MARQLSRIRAVHASDLDALLHALGIADDLARGALLCRACGAQVIRDNLGCVYPEGNEIRICCERPSCLADAMRRVSEVPGSERGNSD